MLKVKATAGRGKRPSPHKKQVVFNIPSESEDDEASDEELATIVRNKQERVAQAKGTTIPLLLDPKTMLNFIDIWHQDPYTLIDDLNLPPGPSHVLTAFIGEEKWKYEKARKAKKAQYKKERFMKNNVLNLTPDQLVSIQKDIKGLSDEFDRYYADWKGAKVRFIKLANKAIKDHKSRVEARSQSQIPWASSSA